MIFFVTCGRGFETFVEDALKEEDVCATFVIDEGKIIFCQCNNGAVQSHNHVCTCLIDWKNHNLEEISQHHFHKSQENLKRVTELLKLKLVEKLYILLYLKVIKNGSAIDNACDVTKAFSNIKFSNAMEVMTDLKQLKSFIQPWKQCPDPVSCPAFASRQEENSKKYSKKRKWSEEKEESKNVTASGNHGEEEKWESSEVDQLVSTDSKSVRVSARIRGKWRSIYKPFDLSKSVMDHILSSNSCWVCSNDKPTLDIYLNLNDKCIIAGASMSDKPLSLRPYISHITLRSTICHLMVRQANIKQGDTVYDPMCGAGTILLEAAMSVQNLRIIASDIDSNQLRAAKCNLRDVQNVEYILSDVMRVPVKDGCIDAIVCDFPFGKKHHVKSYEILLQRLLSECLRILKNRARLVILLSSLQQSHLIRISTDFSNFKILESSFISLGVTPACICTMEVNKC